MSALPIETAAEPVPRMRAGTMRTVLRHPSLMFGIAVLVVITLAALMAPVLAPQDPYAQNISQRLMNPVWYGNGSWEHPLGTDSLGRDYLSRLLYGARISLLVGFVVVLVSGLLGTAMGVAAGYFGGRVDAVVTYLVTLRLSVPLVLVALAVVAAVGSSLTVIVLVLGCLLWDRFAVVTRAATQQVVRNEYVCAAKSLGCSTGYIIVREVLPNIGSQLIVVATLEVANAILMEAALSFLGMGVQAPMPSWGLMISEGRQFMFFKGWLIAIPGATLFLTVLAVNLLGDGLRDVMAPERRS